MSGGGVNTLAFLGALIELDQWASRRYGRPLHALLPCIAGCSMGGFIAAMAISGVPLMHIHSVLRERITHVITTGLGSISMSSIQKTSGGLIPFTVLQSSVHDMITRIIGSAHYTLEEYYNMCGRKPLYLTVTDLQNRQPITLSAHTHPRLPLVDAIAASCCVPGVFSPYLHLESKSVWVDGFLLCNSPTPDPSIPWLILKGEDRTANLFDILRQEPVIQPSLGFIDKLKSIISVQMHALGSIMKVAATMAVFKNQNNNAREHLSWEFPLILPPLPTACSPQQVDDMVRIGREVALRHIVPQNTMVALYAHNTALLYHTWRRCTALQ